MASRAMAACNGSALALRARPLVALAAWTGAATAAGGSATATGAVCGRTAVAGLALSLRLRTTASR